jgi:predicted Zn-ribbon and HTH transcriptional regulator
MLSLVEGKMGVHGEKKMQTPTVCDWCGMRFWHKPIKYAHREFCGEKCKQDWLDVQVRIEKAKHKECEAYFERRLR